jgi:ketosteroid isomerase-like protein
MNIPTFIEEWIAVSNSFDTKKYLEFYLPDATLDDPSVGRKFEGHSGLKKYFDDYFIGYHTYTEQIQLRITDEESAHLQVQFTGNFPEGKIKGTFDFKFTDGKIAYAKANLIH